MKRDAILIKEVDNVATALRSLQSGNPASVGIENKIIEVNLIQDIEYGHTFAIRDIAAGEDIIKYGEIIGRATADIPAGAHAHVQNIESLRGRGDLA